MTNGRSITMTVASAIGLTMLSGCTWFTTVKRYQNIQPTTIDEKLADQPGPDVDKKVTMDFSHALIDSPTAKSGFKSLWDLQGQGQKELIKDLDSNSKGADDFISSLSNKYLKGDDATSLDFTKKRIKLVFSISMWHRYDQLGGPDKGFSEADRIEYINYTFKLRDTAIHFVSWDRYQTKYATINIADLSFQTSVSGGLGYGDTTSGFGANVSASGSRAENQHIQYQYMQLQGRLHGDNLQLEALGTRETNLEGNEIVDVTVRFDHSDVYLFGLDGVKNDNGTLKKPGDLELQAVYAKVPNERNYDSIKADLTYTYAYRHVRKRPQKTFGEFDDKLHYYTGTAKTSVDLLLPQELFPNFYFIDKTDQQDSVLQVSRPNGAGPIQTARLIFQDKKSADDFLSWLYYYPCLPREENDTIVFKNHYTLRIGNDILTHAKLRTINATSNFLQTVKYYTANH